MHSDKHPQKADQIAGDNIGQEMNAEVKAAKTDQDYEQRKNNG